MDKSRAILKLEQDLSSLLIEEACKNDPSKRGTPEMYKYKGLSISTNEKSKDKTKVVTVSIGVLEARYKLENGDKISGNLAPEDERIIQIWLSKSENIAVLQSVFSALQQIRTIAIVPFDLEQYYIRS